MAVLFGISLDIPDIFFFSVGTTLMRLGLSVKFLVEFFNDFLFYFFCFEHYFEIEILQYFFTISVYFVRLQKKKNYKKRRRSRKRAK